jgi:hypothetical protein
LDIQNILVTHDEEQLLNDRVRFKLHAAAQHLNKLKEINRIHGNINNLRLQSEMEIDCFLAHIIGAKDALLVEINNKLNLGIPIEDIELETVNKELNSRNKDGLLKHLNNIASKPNTWFWFLNEIRNHFLHRERIPRHVCVNIFENVNNNTYLVLRGESRSYDKSCREYYKENTRLYIISSCSTNKLYLLIVVIFIHRPICCYIIKN